MNTTFPPGSYFIGDPCYFIPNKEWDDYTNAFFATNPDDHDRAGGHFTYKNEHVFTAYTKYGDGIYEDQHGNEYPVDSGTIGCLPVSLGTPEDNDVIMTFTEEFDVYIEHGVFHIGHVVIDTSDEAATDCYDEDYSDDE